MTSTLIVPGLKNSGPAHWQTWFESVLADTRRVEQADWSLPLLPDWAERVRDAIALAPEPVWIVAHSFGCLAAVAAAASHAERIRGALLVAPADPCQFAIPEHYLEQRLPFPTILVASENDPWLRLPSAAVWARRWGCEFVNAGEAGHINADAGFGPWPAGLELLLRLHRASRIDGEETTALRATIARPAWPLPTSTTRH